MLVIRTIGAELLVGYLRLRFVGAKKQAIEMCPMT